MFRFSRVKRSLISSLVGYDISHGKERRKNVREHRFTFDARSGYRGLHYELTEVQTVGFLLTHSVRYQLRNLNTRSQRNYTDVGELLCTLSAIQNRQRSRA